MTIHYVDKDGDGVPDVFQNRAPIKEVLREVHGDESSAEVPPVSTANEAMHQPRDWYPHFRHSPEMVFEELPNRVVIEIETEPRAPRAGEYFLYLGQICVANVDYTPFSKFVVISRVLAGNPGALQRIDLDDQPSWKKFM